MESVIYDTEPRELVCDYVSCELVLETARTCRTLSGIIETMDVEITAGETQQKVIRSMNRINLFFRLVPSILDPRRLICLGDMAADRPEWWKSNRIHFFDPELTHKQIAAVLGLNPHQVRDAIHAVEIPTDCYNNLPPMQQY